VESYLTKRADYGRGPMTVEKFIQDAQESYVWGRELLRCRPEFDDVMQAKRGDRYVQVRSPQFFYGHRLESPLKAKRVPVWPEGE
jgi:hypothetical protein